MGGAVKDLKPNGRAGPPMTDAGFILCYAFTAGVWAVFAAVWGCLRGIDLVSAALGSAGAALGVILGLSAFVLVYREFERVQRVGGTVAVLFPVTMCGSQAPMPFLPALVIGFVTTAFTLLIAGALCGPLERAFGSRDSKRSDKVAPLQSNHTLYDSEVDGATRPSVRPGAAAGVEGWGEGS